MSAIFLDLDGTLTDPRRGITAAIRHALIQIGVAAPDPDQLTWAIGPPLIDSFRALGVDDPDLALDHYRAHYNDGGLFDATVFPGILDALARLKAQGHRLYLATAKPHAYATKITAHFGIARFMDAEFGPELDGTRNDKADLLAYALDRTGTRPDEAVMVGDRRHDLDAARKNGLPGLGVTWGYGQPGELDGAARLLSDPRRLAEDLAEFLAAPR